LSKQLANEPKIPPKKLG